MKSQRTSWKKRKEKILLLLLSPGGVATVLITGLLALLVPILSCNKTRSGENSNNSHNSSSVAVTSNTGSTISVNSLVNSPIFNSNAQVIVSGSTQALSIINNYYAPGDTTVKDVVTALELRLRTNSETIDLTRKEVKLIADSLRDLDRRTEALQVMPDGRTRFGNVIAGAPRYVIQELQAAIALQRDGDLVGAFGKATNAIGAYESSSDGSAMIINQKMAEKPVAAMYEIGALTALSLGRKEIGLKWAAEASKRDPNLEVETVHILALAISGMNDEAEQKYTKLIAKHGKEAINDNLLRLSTWQPK